MNEPDLRDWFAGLAMQAIINVYSGSLVVETLLPFGPELAYEIADAMMRARDRPA